MIYLFSNSEYLLESFAIKKFIKINTIKIENTTNGMYSKISQSSMPGISPKIKKNLF